MGEGKLTPLTRPTTQSTDNHQIIAYVITSIISSPHAKFGQDRRRAYFYPYSQSYHSFLPCDAMHKRGYCSHMIYVSFFLLIE